MQYFNIPALEQDFRATVLVVDDDTVSGEMISEGLKSFCTIYQLSNGQAALDFCKNTLPDMILLDLNMPEMDGAATLAHLKAEPFTKDIPVIFITADMSAETENKCWEAGCVDFVTKPLTIQTLRHRVNAHLASKFMFDMLKRQATTDGLTGIQNRRYLDDFLLKQSKLCERTNRPLGLLLLDIDHFKKFNDTLGHQAGDACLKRIAGCLRHLVRRPTDCIARYGGEEFIIVLPDTDAVGVKRLADTIHKEIEDLNIQHPSVANNRLTVSIGGTVTNHRPALPKQMIKKADENLYLAKANGRNTSIISN